MKIEFLGVGGAFDTQVGNSAALVQAGKGKAILIDCGCTTHSDLCRTGRIDQVTHVLITHMHDDHVGSLGSTIFHAAFILGHKLELLAAPGLVGSLRGLLQMQVTTTPIDQVVSFREMREDADDPARQVGDLHISWIDTKGKHQPGMQTYAYVLRSRDELLAYSGDLGDPNLIFDTLEEQEAARAVICHDVTFRKLPNQAHAYYRDLQAHLPKWRIIGYHNDPQQAPSDCSIDLAANIPGMYLR